MHQNQYFSPFLQSLEYRFHQPLTKRTVRRALQSLENRILLSPVQLYDSKKYIIRRQFIIVKSAFHGQKSPRTVNVVPRSLVSLNWKMLDHLKIIFLHRRSILSVIILFNKGNYIHVNHYGVYENNCIRNQSVNMQMAHHSND